ncbi:MAG: hypothetical protein AAFU80_04550 [Pseudomonadota bacterium]
MGREQTKRRATAEWAGRIAHALRAAPVLAPLALAGCAQLGLPQLAPRSVAPADPGAPIETVANLPEGADPSPGTAASAPPPRARTVEEFDTTSAAERAAAASDVPSSAPEEVLGTSIATLGDPTLPGFWAETPLVQAVRPGRLTDPATGNSVQVELRPAGDAGTRVSLPALRVLEVPLTALPELTVIGL